jgi:hypothetical protein
MKEKSLGGVVAMSLALCAGAAQGITIQFDYSYDAEGFFSADKRAVLNQVASLYGSNLTDSLSAFTSAGGNHASFSFFDPANDADTINLTNQSLAADTLRIFVGSSALGSGVLAIGGPGGTASSGSAAFNTAVTTRGQTGASLPTPTDFGPWGGAVSFSSSFSWYADADVTTLESFSGTDFYSVAMHEVGHVLGIGTAPSWSASVLGSTFVGSNAEAVAGGAVALNSVHDHWASGTASSINGVSQLAAMSPSISSGERKYFTELDWAALRDVGWQVTSLDAFPVAAVPEPANYAMLLAGLGLFGVMVRRRYV